MVQRQNRPAGRLIRLLQLSLLWYGISLWPADIRACREFVASDQVNDIRFHQGKLFAGTDKGTVDIFDLRHSDPIYRIVFDFVKTGRGDLVPANVQSLDLYQNKIAILTIGDDGFSEVWLYERGELKKVVDAKRRLIVKRVRFPMLAT